MLLVKSSIFAFSMQSSRHNCLLYLNTSKSLTRNMIGAFPVRLFMVVEVNHWKLVFKSERFG